MVLCILCIRRDSWRPALQFHVSPMPWQHHGTIEKSTTKIRRRGQHRGFGDDIPTWSPILTEPYFDPLPLADCPDPGTMPTCAVRQCHHRTEWVRHPLSQGRLWNLGAAEVLLWACFRVPLFPGLAEPREIPTSSDKYWNRHLFYPRRYVDHEAHHSVSRPCQMHPSAQVPVSIQ